MMSETVQLQLLALVHHEKTKEGQAIRDGLWPVHLLTYITLSYYLLLSPRNEIACCQWR